MDRHLPRDFCFLHAMSKRKKKGRRRVDADRRREEAPDMFLVVQADPPAPNLPLLITSIGLLVAWAVFLLVVALVQ